MKQLITLAFVSFVCVSFGVAQIAPNGGFENWTGSSPYVHPVSWNGTDSATSNLGVSGTMQQSTDAHSGSYALRSEAKYLSLGPTGRMVPGLATTGKILLLEEKVIDGPAYTERPDSLVGWYKYTRTFSDTMYVQLVLLDANDDTVGFAEFTNIQDVGTYTRFSQPINYHTAGAPAYGHIIVRHATSNDAGGVGSVILIDDVDVVFKTSGINDKAKSAVKLYPNPAKNFISIDNPTGDGVKVSIYDAIGRETLKRELTVEQKQLDFQLADGVYVVEIKQNNKVIKLQKLVVQH